MTSAPENTTKAKREPAKRERGTGRIYQPRNPQHPERPLQVWWIDYSIEGRRFRESSKRRKRSDAAKLLKHRLGQTPEQAGARAQRLTFEDLEDGIVESRGRKATGPLSSATHTVFPRGRHEDPNDRGAAEGQYRAPAASPHLGRPHPQTSPLEVVIRRSFLLSTAVVAGHRASCA